MSGRRGLAVAVVLGVLAMALPSVAWAGTAEDPELTDPCGPAEEIGNDLLPEPAPPWGDVCAAWFETLTGDSGPAALRVSMALAGDITQRPTPTTYHLAWRIDDCVYRVEQRDPATAFSSAYELRHRCEPAPEPEPCSTPVISCQAEAPYTITQLPEAVFSEDGDVLAVTLVFADGLEELAATFAEGAVLERLSAAAWPTGGAGTYCVGADCGSGGGDYASGGRTYVMEGGSGPAVDAPRVPSQPACAEVSVDEASADRPHVRDPEGDHNRGITHSGSEGPGYDLRALWLSRAADGLNLHVLPAGPADPGTTLYIVFLDDRSVWIEGQPDGTWTAWLREETGEWPSTGSATAVDVAVSAETGEAVVTLPDALLSDAEVVRISDFFSHYMIGGQAPRPAPGMSMSHSVDDQSGAAICDARR